MSQEDVEMLRRLYEQWATGDLSSTDFFDPNAEYSRIGSETPGMEGQWSGFDAMKNAMREYLRPFADLRIEAERIIDLGEGRVLVLSRHTARGKQSGVPIEHENGDLFELRDGKIVRYDAYWNRADALEAAGLSD
jgi:ketosteroid isomerase-like protein